MPKKTKQVSKTKCSTGAYSTREAAVKSVVVTPASWGQGSAFGDFSRAECGSGHIVTTENARNGKEFKWFCKK